MTRVCTVLVRQADGDRGRDGEMMTAGEGTTLWTASVAELPDCTVTGESFEELEAAMRDRLLGLGRGRHGAGHSPKEVSTSNSSGPSTIQKP